MASGVLYIFRGLSGSGKSSIASAMLSERLLDVVVTSDDIRRELDPAFQFKPLAEMSREDWIFQRRVEKERDLRIAKALRQGLRVGSADTNISPKAFATLESLACGCGACVVVITIVAPVELCISQDAQRKNSIGAGAIQEQLQRWGFGQ